jgi:uncharacterized Zn-finger protein
MIRAVAGKGRAIMAQNDAPREAGAPEVIEVDFDVVACDGGGGALGHPRVYLSLAGRDFVECGYCDRRFVRKAGAKAAAH